MSRRGEDAESDEGAGWLVLRHTQLEGLGLLANTLREVGVQHRILDLSRGDPAPRDIRDLGGLIVLGGPMAAYELDRHPFLKAEVGLIEKAITAGRPVLGICLGAQLIAHVLGARVFAGDRREVGWAPVTVTPDGRDDPVLLGVEPSLTVFHLHGDTYELPPDARNLATSPRYEQQAFSFGDTVYGFQFHLEFTETIISRLTGDPETQRYMTEAGADPQAIAAETPERVRNLSAAAQKIFTAYFQQCGL